MLAIELLFFGTRSFRCPCQPTLLLFLLLLLLLLVVMLLFFSDAVTERLLEFEGL